MTTINQIKQELRDIIELSDKATPGPWVHHVEQGQVGDICTPDTDSVAMTQERIEIAKKHGREHRKRQNEQRNINASFIAASRNLTPKMARALLTAIIALETLAASEVSADPYEACSHLEDARDALETIRREWEVQV